MILLGGNKSRQKYFQLIYYKFYTTSLVGYRYCFHVFFIFFIFSTFIHMDFRNRLIPLMRCKTSNQTMNQILTIGVWVHRYLNLSSWFIEKIHSFWSKIFEFQLFEKNSIKIIYQMVNILKKSYFLYYILKKY